MHKYSKIATVLITLEITFSAGVGVFNSQQLTSTNANYKNISIIENQTNYAQSTINLNPVQYHLPPNGNSAFAIINDSINADRLYAWGINANSQLGISSLRKTNLPTLVDSLPLNASDQITAISTSDTFTMVVVNNAAVHVIGSNTYRQLGLGNIGQLPLNKFFQIFPEHLPPSITSVSAGTYHGSAIADNKLYTWGDNTSGQLGNGTTTGPVDTPTIINHTDWTTTGTFTEVNNSTDHSSVIYNGSLYIWGLNTDGLVGNGTYAPTTIPTKVIFPNPGVISQFTFNKTAFAVIDNKLYGWGKGTSGEFGNGLNRNFNTPTLINVPAGTIKAIKVLDGATLIQIDDKIYATGINNEGQLGLGDNINRTTFTEINSFNLSENAVWMNTAASNFVMKDNAIYAWGGNTNGQFGNGTNNNYNQPTLVDPFGKPSKLISKSNNQSVSAKQALQVLNPTGSIIYKNILATYVDGVNSFPSDTEFKLTAFTTPQVDNVNGILKLSLSVNKYYGTPDGEKRQSVFNITDFEITGFAKVASSTAITVKNDGAKTASPDEWEWLIKNNGRITINELTPYFNFEAVPEGTLFTISDISHDEQTNVKTFKIQADRYYDGNGKLQNNPSEHFSLTLQLGKTNTLVQTAFPWWWVILGVIGITVIGTISFILIKKKLNHKNDE